MKSLLFPTLLLIFSFCIVAQDQSPCYSVNDYQAQIQESNPPISYQLVAGWNIVGYTGTADNNGIVTQLNQSLTNNATAANTFQIIKNVTGQFWSSAFAQLSNFTPGEGYMMYVVSETAPVLSFNRPLTLPLIVGCTDCTAENFNPWASQGGGYCIILGCTAETATNYNALANTDDGSCIILGCLAETATNYNEFANTDDGSCIAVVLGCTDATAFNYDVTANTDDGSCIAVALGCLAETATNYNALANTDDGSCIVLGCIDATAFNYDVTANTDDGSCTYPLAIGSLAHGGMVFYVDETGEHGLVAALEDLGQFEWGCFDSDVNGAIGTAIGTGYQNTLDISAQNCQTANGGITAAEATLNYETEGYTDWFLPSIYELEEIYNTIGNGGSEGNIGGFDISVYPHYWSSSENSSTNARYVTLSHGNSSDFGKNNSLKVRAVRAF